MSKLSESLMHEVVWFLKRLLLSFIPAWGIVALYFVFMPASGSPAFSSLELHQQLIALASLPATIWSLWRFQRGLDDAKPSPEERTLDE